MACSQYAKVLIVLVSVWATTAGERQVCEYRCNLADCVNNEVWHEVEMDGPNGDKIVLQQTLRQRPREQLVGSRFPGLGRSNFFRKFLDVFVTMGERRRAEQQYRNDVARQRVEQFQQRSRMGRVAVAERRSQRAVRERPERQNARPRKRSERQGKRNARRGRVADQ
nr:uncharacterized protein LOC115265738 [Aedes albopictus]